ncbi:MAG: class I SAM-dependent methyltransferase [Minwuia sp.]|uniref:class I SAM-dependent methyltransferase n=1 Tax=Minwuia sp. TaxID=2493630 RepID=UPI003A86D246
MADDEIEAAVARHYGSGELLERILAGLEQLGLDAGRIDPVELAPVDEFHTAGRTMTVKALDMTPLEAGMHVLDVGCGIGGTSRYLAHERDCQVTGIDLTPEYIEVARDLTSRTGLADRCHFELASALEMPFEDGIFDAAVTFHVAMNIEDRQGLYGEIARVLRPGAPLCIFDVMKGPALGMHYPVPWAETAETSFLRSPDDMRVLLDHAGFTLLAEESQKDFASEFFRKAFAAQAQADGPPPLGLHLLTGANSPEKFRNYATALDENMIEPWIMVATRR